MTRPGVTYFDVANVAQQLIASGHEPTIERVRSQLKTGSNTTIGTHLRTWRSKLAQKLESQLHWQSQHDKVYAKWEEQMKLSADLQAQNAVLSQQMMVIKKELDVIAEQNKVLAHDKWILGQEKAQLFGQLKQWESMAATG